MKRLLLIVLHVYRRAVSPAVGPCCRFEPSCSAYAEEAIGTHGVLRGLGLVVWRLLRCNPFSRAGLDPVPPRASATGNPL
ncbi:MAG TPA: membrane protein insertion efficiency factor YidD [Polyangia bacterium]|jgi:putative membrane protein insertion efficiency factor|nr:membrane protein insertion efficiency factor YidD [Polyangia bacterium]